MYHETLDDKDNNYYQLIMWRVCVGKFDFGTVALEADQMRTLKKQDLQTALDKLIDNQKRMDISNLIEKIDGFK